MLKDIFLFAGSLFTYDHTFIYLFYFFLVVAIIIAIAIFSTRSLQLVPHGMQNIAEAYVGGVLSIGKDTMGSEERAKKYLPLVATLGLVVFLSNIIGLIPGFESPTSSLNLTLSLTLCVWFYYHFEGIREHGVVGYFKHFMGPVKALAPFMFIVELISHFARVVSLSFRLFGNIKGDDMFLLVMLTLFPALVPMVPYALLTFMAILQTFIFMVLSYVYLAGAVVVDEH
ncbi:F0F1 ATP synthase subunit A [Campylobacter sp. JMF_01 NE2]|uniref:F0F1 ATP synthase subunit A n=1 Tax=unclassified Campylobacter TaxID=2593542 RepID=UPI001B6AD8F7|nr:MULTISPECIES: F0F1 ATP synthase subunit A [unclassified Campylobacter]MBP3223823.1 F0F1 ATP synthase subunit A [Campylobacter sp.]MDA3043464.1 F0F1 ATP synthase subunit A [Campylobacter sp. JMF_09 ED2]MDA3045218.1 F0F1 ATP synthase subunit A [Campylobacter sp. JMF_07 ED4]MDA3046055.1 F0F1 ATP synthase subunit A [Campylobacter sp. VBCF_06 NA8]MDA3048246.1 F0F1 ATP synthase subunit A [Campylobacter sp. JMF_08 NE1]